MPSNPQKENFLEKNKGLIQQFVRNEAAKKFIKTFTKNLSEQQISCIPIKGIVTQQLFFDDPLEKKTEDIDLLILPNDFEKVQTILRKMQFKNRLASKANIQMLFFRSDHPNVDVHFQLFGFGRFNMSTEKLFERSKLNSDLFGIEVRLLSDMDLYAHLLGKLVTDGILFEHTIKWKELERAGSRLNLDPKETALHLKECGMQRASLYALSFLAKEKKDVFAKKVLIHTDAQLRDHKIIFIAQRLIQKSKNRIFRSLGAHLLNTNLPKAIWSIGLAFMHRIRYYSFNAIKRPFQ